VLNKREGYRRAFSRFDPEKVARYSPARIDKLTTDPGIVRNRLKIAAAVKNARAFLAVQEEFGSFDAYCWHFVDGRPRQNRWTSVRKIPCNDRRVRRIQPRSQAPRVQLRRIDSDLRAHASGRHGQRPRD
jgi:DNA-3-methyladenine glycosylase I